MKSFLKYPSLIVPRTYLLILTDLFASDPFIPLAFISAKVGGRDLAAPGVRVSFVFESPKTFFSTFGVTTMTTPGEEEEVDISEEKKESE